ncbi:putative F-box protein At3g16210 [Papaver somniferum]|uniref:putative F-box protein At3g16210 n=1 Tax=Papaver somniferum TaxID=3469 RepID=UPI000E700BF3|nr:putative F-box protein At3g16210 [Papaver somniferum]
MSRLPEGILENIFLRLKVKNLLRCRCVCKAWRDLICSPSFIYKHLNVNNTIRILVSCNGLLCIYSSNTPDDVSFVITIWNPSSNEYKQLPRPSKKACYDIDYYGFGYDYKNDDYKVVRIVDYFLETGAKSDVEVYTLRSDSWKSIDAIP